MFSYLRSRIIFGKELVRIYLWLGKYRILSILNSSSVQSEVFLAENVKLKERRVIKRIRKNHPFFLQLSKEALFLKILKGKHTPFLYDVEEDEENLYIVMEYLNGVAPDEAFFRTRMLTEKELFMLAEGLFTLFRTLRKQERPILYLDWKPENLLLTETGVKIVDFGSAVFEDEADRAHPLSTAGFSAPELKDGGKVSLYTEIYGFGALLKFFAENTCGRRKRLFGKSFVSKVLRLSEACMVKQAKRRKDPLSMEKILLSRNHKKVGGEENEDRLLFRGNERVIGVSGAFKGAGTTYIAAKIATLLSEKKKKVAFLSVGAENGDREFHAALTERTKGRMTCKSVRISEILRIINEDYDHIIIDFGRMEKEIEEEFLRTDKKIIVFTYDGVKRYYTEHFLKEHGEMLSASGMTLLVNLCEETEVSEMKEKMKALSLKGRVAAQPFEKF